MIVRLDVPREYLLARDVCSYGYFLLEPNHWSPDARAFRTTIDLDGRAVTVRITQGDLKQPTRSFAKLRGRPLTVHADARLSKSEGELLSTRLSRLLDLCTPASTLRDFHALDTRFKKVGRGRLMRSPTLFEDVIKTVTSCNVQWPSTIVINRRLCETLGTRSASGLHAFPTPEKLARVRPASLRARCRVGYRDARIVELARMFADGRIDPARIEDPHRSDDDLLDELLDWPGIGPYAAANILQLLRRFSRLPLDTESVRHGKAVLGFTGTPKQIMKRVHDHFLPMGAHRFRSYWFEIWSFYEQRHGPAWTWVRETTGTQFTASKLQSSA